MRISGRPVSRACNWRYVRYESGMASQSSPVSIDFFASDFILARLPRSHELTILLRALGIAKMYAPILEPYLDRPLRHVDLLSNPLTDRRSGSRIFSKLDLKEA